MLVLIYLRRGAKPAATAEKQRYHPKKSQPSTSPNSPTSPNVTPSANVIFKFTIESHFSPRVQLCDALSDLLDGMLPREGVEIRGPTGNIVHQDTSGLGLFFVTLGRGDDRGHY
ncbi:hypothetical protein NEUTE2DRAFT_60804 [Neurospora tetrasperma FGSC 2509]|nr:hypothetical protein NEUTE2DRAFT_60804 [Neurospora tetrasperma FGSC 2509]